MVEKSTRQPASGTAKEKKRAEALRQNLLRRKEQARGRETRNGER